MWCSLVGFLEDIGEVDCGLHLEIKSDLGFEKVDYHWFRTIQLGLHLNNCDCCFTEAKHEHRNDYRQTVHVWNCTLRVNTISNSLDFARRLFLKTTWKWEEMLLGHHALSYKSLESCGHWCDDVKSSRCSSHGRDVNKTLLWPTIGEQYTDRVVYPKFDNMSTLYWREWRASRTQSLWVLHLPWTQLWLLLVTVCQGRPCCVP